MSTTVTRATRIFKRNCSLCESKYILQKINIS